MTKSMTLRLDDERAATLMLVARIDGVTVTDCVRLAIDAHARARRADPRWRRRAEEHLRWVAQHAAPPQQDEGES
ncbi:hypothetical protein [Conexibacter woesei]|uniref:CopG domain protein DNA-binding domain protein n=1 Tax=Conexibacter woesei (strain DSM 14684 / CCUG 47730 / CIP 108061 / JCM 11494 / NBRC 100937 / ID131577) TaxID=469383 RepID=D3FEB4_CONWI|nr:hypothetical protein [Conexibacter woesei]ADB53606.1 hypothetical protein Cwoe_5198 [Conexibacter woesei DSM 14684]